MQSASREALGVLRSDVTAVLDQSGSTDGLAGLADELYAISSVLTSQPRLRRRLADPAQPAEARRGLLRTLLQGKVSANALSIAESAAAQRWSNAWDLVDAIEGTGDDVLLAAAEKDGVIDSVEDELFRLERILDAEANLTTLLDEATVDPGRRSALLDGVVAGKVHPLTQALVRHAVTTQRKRSILLAIDDLITLAGDRRARSVARVVSAVELTDQQQGNLAERLTSMYGRQIEVRYAVDPKIRGGLVVRVGDEVIDGSVSSRLARAHQAFSS